MEDRTKKKRTMKDRYAEYRKNLIWILIEFLVVFYILCRIVYIPWNTVMSAVSGRVSSIFSYIMQNYTGAIPYIFVLFLWTWYIRPNRYIWKSFLLPKKSAAASEEDRKADFYGRSRNSFRMLAWGFLIGFLMNGFTIACALIHGDIKLYFESSLREIPMLLFALVSVLIQSSAEELWCRGFLYERIHERYPLWAAILVNGVLFGVMHLLNEGAAVLSVAEIAVSGVAYSLFRWYSGNIWSIMGVHTAWNFTQAFLFGLPNSGLVSELSLFHLSASNGVSNLIYDFTFGVEGCLPAFITDLAVIVIVIILAARNGRLKELGMNCDRTMNRMKSEVGKQA